MNPAKKGPRASLSVRPFSVYHPLHLKPAFVLASQKFFRQFATTHAMIFDIVSHYSTRNDITIIMTKNHEKKLDRHLKFLDASPIFLSPFFDFSGFAISQKIRILYLTCFVYIHFWYITWKT